jgi:hypothetical protein
MKRHSILRGIYKIVKLLQYANKITWTFAHVVETQKVNPLTADARCPNEYNDVFYMKLFCSRSTASWILNCRLHCRLHRLFCWLRANCNDAYGRRLKKTLRVNVTVDVWRNLWGVWIIKSNEEKNGCMGRSTMVHGPTLVIRLPRATSLWLGYEAKKRHLRCETWQNPDKLKPILLFGWKGIRVTFSPEDACALPCAVCAGEKRRELSVLRYSCYHRRMARGGHGLARVSPRPAMPYPSTPVGGIPLWPFQGWPAFRVGGLRPSSTLLDTPRCTPIGLWCYSTVVILWIHSHLSLCSRPLGHHMLEVERGPPHQLQGVTRKFLNLSNTPGLVSEIS